MIFVYWMYCISIIYLFSGYQFILTCLAKHTTTGRTSMAARLEEMDRCCPDPTEEAHFNEVIGLLYRNT